MISAHVSRVCPEHGRADLHKRSWQRRYPLAAKVMDLAAWGREEQVRTYGERLACAEAGTASD